MNYYFFIYIWKEIYIINMIQSQPKLGDFVSLSDTYILVVRHRKTHSKLEKYKNDK